MTQGTSTQDPTAHAAPNAGRDGVMPSAALKLDPDKYRGHLEPFDLSEAQQNELLATLWNILRSFVEIGFGLDSVQLFSTAEHGLRAEITGPDSGKTLEDHHQRQRFNRTASPRAAREDANE